MSLLCAGAVPYQKRLEEETEDKDNVLAQLEAVDEDCSAMEEGVLYAISSFLLFLLLWDDPGPSLTLNPQPLTLNPNPNPNLKY
jgi:hypothetical protein